MKIVLILLILFSTKVHSLPLIIVDKVNAKVFVFDSVGNFKGSAPVLLGLQKGDKSPSDIGDRKYADIPKKDRTTPAGRFVAELGKNLRGEDVLWVDYNSALSLHRVVTSNSKELRSHRLATPTPRDNRISFGCINVPAKFFDNVVYPAFLGTKGIVIILPEKGSL